MITNKSLLWKYISNIFISIDQLGNVIAGGYADNTISARIGYYNNHYFPDRSLVPFYWKILEKIIDFTFRPVDGPNHCHEAYHNDPSEVFNSRVTNFLVVFASVIIIIPSCIVIFLILFIVTTLGIVKQKTIDRNINIEKRFEGCHKYVRSIKYEVSEHYNDIDKQNLNDLKESLINTVNTIS